MAKRVLLAAPRGYCAGVDRAVVTVEKALDLYGAPVYVRKQIVHNVHVVSSLEKKGAIFVDETDQVPEGAIVIFSAHGVSPKVHEQAAARNLKTIDATCPLVTKVHLEAIKFAREHYTIVLIGHQGHDEVIGTMGEAPEAIVLVESTQEVDCLEYGPDTKLAYLTQTTLSVDDANRIIQRLKSRFPWIVGPPKEDICYATQNRQEAVRVIADEATKVIVLGSQNSSNSQRLRELAQEQGRTAYLVDGPEDLSVDWFEESDVVLVTAGASAPEEVVASTLAWLESNFNSTLELREVRKEEVHFPLPRALRVLQ